MIQPNPLDTVITPETNEAELARSITDSVVAQLPEEKKKADADMLQTAQELQGRGSDWVDGRGQLIGSIPPRVYMRWAQMLPGCWQDKSFVTEFLIDNPQCRAPGYRPVERSVGRKSISLGASFYHQNKAKVA